MFNLLFCIVNYIFVGASVSPHLKMGVLDARDFIKADTGVPSEEVEKFLKKEPHDSEFYFYCGLAASNVVNDISHKNGSSRLLDDDVVNDLVLFTLLIGM